MKTLKLSACYALVSAAVIAGCSATGDVSPLSPNSANRVLTSATAVGQAGDNVPNQGEVEVCKFGTDASFDVTPAGGSTTRYNIADGSCVVVVLDVTTGNTANSYQIQEVASSSYNLQSIQRTDIQFQANTQIDIVGSPFLTNDPVTALVNAFHGVRLVYHNVPVVQNGCTYTQGWYKNPKHVWPAGPLQRGTAFDGGASLETILNTPPKGSKYLILAHQYITALLNIQGGASVPSDVQDALDTAADYFAGGGAGAGDPNVNIDGISTILDEYNNGIRGPGHCDDEVLQ